MQSTTYPKVMFKTASLVTNEKGILVIKIKFPFNHNDLNNVRTLYGRKYHSELKCWSCPLSVESLQILISWGYSIDDKLKEYYQNTQELIKKTKFAEMEKINLSIPGLKGKLRPFQKASVIFADAKNGNILNADDMGLGKTIETIAYLQLRKEKLPALIVTPAAVKINWKREIQKWMSPTPNVQILSGETPFKIHTDICIINYDILTHWTNAIGKYPFNMIIADEAQAIKNSSAKRTKAFKKIKKGISTFMALTGTPIENHPSELYNVINMINPALFPVAWDFYWEFCNPVNNGYGWTYSGATNIPKLHKILTESIMLRRLKKDVLLELPEKTTSFIPIELTNQKEYDFAEKDFIQFVKEQKGHEAAERASNAESIQKIETLKQLAVKGKLKGAINWIKDFLECDKKLVIVTTHTFVIDELIKAFPGISLKLDGSITGEKRQEVVDNFQKDPVYKLFIMNLKAGGVGITLTASSDVVILELGWNPKIMDQAADRVHRIGQTRGVNIYYLLALNTIEEKIAELLDKKRKIIDGVIDGIETGKESLLMELMNSYS
jgi:SWI/SNF-related matrix-associated actin-dependent regulator of chromatin subfamily A-like protein 1